MDYSAMYIRGLKLFLKQSVKLISVLFRVSLYSQFLSRPSTIYI